jgi:hypothetical protein
VIRAQRKGRGSIFKSHSHHRKGAAKLRSVVRNPNPLRRAALCALSRGPGRRGSVPLRGFWPSLSESVHGCLQRTAPAARSHA